MTFWHGFWIITGVHFLACMSPGPDFVLVSQQALSRGRAAGMLTALGIALGFGIHYKLNKRRLNPVSDDLSFLKTTKEDML